MAIWAFAALWTGLQLGHKNWQADAYSRKNLLTIEALIDAYKRQTKEQPQNLAELKVLTIDDRLAVSFYDSYGFPFQYIYLDPKSYILRAFAKDGSQALDDWSDQNQAVFDLPILPQQTPQFIASPLMPIKVYPSVLLAGTYSPDGSLHAQIYQDKERPSRLLVVRDKNLSSRIMVANHDFVEEFLWLKGKNSIVFTAAQSLRYSDGLYYWNLAKGRTVNLISILSREMESIFIGLNQKPQDSTYLISLAGIGDRENSVYFFAAVKSGEALPARDFYTEKNLYRLTIDAGEEFRISRAEFSLRGARPVFPLLIDSMSPESDIRHGSDVQQKWQGLSLTGQTGEVLEQWQEYSEKNSHSPNFSYALWYLACLYNDAFAAAKHKPKTKKNSEVLRSYGAEIAKALRGANVAPLYLRSLGTDVYQQLLQGQPLTFKISQLAD